MFLVEIPIGIVVSDIAKEVPFLRHVTSNIYFVNNFIFKTSMLYYINLKVKHQGQGQGNKSRSRVKGQGHVFSAIVVILYHQ